MNDNELLSTKVPIVVVLGTMICGQEGCLLQILLFHFAVTFSCAGVKCDCTMNVCGSNIAFLYAE